LMKPGTIVDWIMRGKSDLAPARLRQCAGQRSHRFGWVRPLIDPPEREKPAGRFVERAISLEHDKTVAIVNSPTYAWRHLGLVEPDGTPTRRGMIFSFFPRRRRSSGRGPRSKTKPIRSTNWFFDLANIRAGPRFAGEDAPIGGRLGILCQRVYRRADYPGYLSMGVPVHYGAGASEVVGARWWLIRAPSTSSPTNCLRHGDIERALVEWRSILRHIVLAPAYPLSRWTELKAAAKRAGR